MRRHHVPGLLNYARNFFSYGWPDLSSMILGMCCDNKKHGPKLHHVPLPCPKQAILCFAAAFLVLLGFDESLWSKQTYLAARGSQASMHSEGYKWKPFAGVQGAKRKWRRAEAVL